MSGSWTPVQSESFYRNWPQSGAPEVPPPPIVLLMVTWNPNEHSGPTKTGGPADATKCCAINRSRTAVRRLHVNNDLHDSVSCALAVVLVVILLAGATARATPQASTGEVVATLATGRAIFCVTHDGIVVAAVSGGGEAGSLIPAIVPIRANFVGVLLGAVEWNTPDSSAKPTRLDAELPTVALNAIRQPNQKVASGPSDIEDIGVAMLEVLRPFVTQIHHKLDLAPDEPLLELVLADYAPNYGPEIWSLRYRIRQQSLGNDYWNTSILRPAYYQLYPPEKGQPRTFIEVRYPGESAEPTLAARVAAHDPQLERFGNASPELTKALGFIYDGNSTKAATSPISDFLRSAVPAVASANARMTLAIIDAERGFQWVLPPEERLPPPKTQSVDPDRPSLRNPRGPSP